MKPIRSWIVLIFVLMNGWSLQGQNEEQTDETNSNRKKIGIGISFGTNTHRFGDDDDYGYFKTGAIMGIYVPINFGDRWRIEPEVSYNNMSGKISRSDDDYYYKSNSTVKISRYGVGILRRKKRDHTETYFGARLGKVFIEDKTRFTYSAPGYEDGDTDKRHKSDLYFGPVAGGEYYFSPYFSFGGEAQLIYTKVGRMYGDEYEDDPDEDISYNVHAWDTRAHLFVRWYF
ncbi:hypothetical protein L6Q79_07295 [bacterium]|nr:hypothetical protein [bacterium]NUN44631.1 hypothetical protein [bacterium]